jgi:glycosyltransferase involved in cell wall biosynthesis
MAKINVLVLNTDTDGIGYYRMLTPHIALNEYHNDEIECDIKIMYDQSIPLVDEKFLSKYQIIVFNKFLPLNDNGKSYFLQLTKKHNIKLVYDIDDYWLLNNNHINYKNWKNNNSDKMVEKVLRNEVDYVMTTTPLFANIIKELNKNVVVIENATNLDEQQWTPNKNPSDKTRFIWSGGISHGVDLKLLKDSFKKFDKDFISKTQLYLCGYDLRVKMPDGSITMDDPRRSQWGFFESIFTNDYKYIFNPKYREYLFAKITKNISINENFGLLDEFKNEFYQRIWTRAILDYGHNMNNADISIAPLKNNYMFNYCKSQLKVIEAGAHLMPIILSNYGPYTVDDIEGTTDGKRKGFLVDEKIGDWYEKMKWYVDNKNAIIEHGNNLREYVEKNYSLKVITNKRLEFYKNILKK